MNHPMAHVRIVDSSQSFTYERYPPRAWDENQVWQPCFSVFFFGALDLQVKHCTSVMLVMPRNTLYRI